MIKIIEIKVILNNFYFYKKLKQRHYALHNHFLKKYDLKDIQDILKFICCWIDWIMGKLELHGEL